MDRQQREAELRMMLTSQRGKEELLAILKEHAGLEQGNLPPFGTLLVETILNYEYQPQDLPEPGQGQGMGAGTEPIASRPTPEKAESGDRKFAEPPAQEAPGG